MFKRTAMLAALSLTLLSAPALAQMADAPQPQTSNGVTFVSGGVGLDGRQALRQIEKNYNMHLMFAATRTGQYLGDVQVKLIGARKQPVLDVVSHGPYFLAKVKPGRYQLTATFNNQSVHRTITVPSHGTASQNLYWTVED